MSNQVVSTVVVDGVSVDIVGCWDEETPEDHFDFYELYIGSVCISEGETLFEEPSEATVRDFVTAWQADEALREVEVRIAFNGTAVVKVPRHLEFEDAYLLAEKLALAQVLATFVNPDCGECLESAEEQYMRECGEAASATAAQDFAAAQPLTVSGLWRTDDAGVS